MIPGVHKYVDIGVGPMHRGKRKSSEVNPALLDKMGERLTFEQISVGLYDALSRKRQNVLARDCPLETIERFRQEELDHLGLLERSLRHLGRSPAASCASAYLAAQASLGLQKLVQNSETSFGDSLEAMVIAAATDNLGWELLISLALQAGLDDMAWEFCGALREEQIQLSTLRSWVEDLALHEKIIPPEYGERSA